MSRKRQTYSITPAETIFDFPTKPEPKSFAQFIYDSTEGSFFGRTPKNWGQLLIFYTIFYIVLAALFAICLQGLFATLSDVYPKWQLDRSLIGSNPGMSYRPMLEPENGNELIKYSASSKKEVKQWVRAMNEFLKPYINTTTPVKSKRVQCDFDKPPKDGEVCKYEIAPEFDVCANNLTFGFNTSAPCLYIKLNKIYGWIPDFYNNSEDLHPDMPDDLVKHIKDIKDSLELNQVWVSCQGRKPDTVREIKFVGNRGFPGYFYPFRNLDGYQSPLVPIQIHLEPKQIEEANQVQIECRAWAKNILYSGSMRERLGSVLIEIAIEV